MKHLFKMKPHLIPVAAQPDKPWQGRLQALRQKIINRQSTLPGLPVNRKWQFQTDGISQTSKDLRRALKEGHVIQVREGRFGSCRQTYLTLNPKKK